MMRVSRPDFHTEAKYAQPAMIDHGNDYPNHPGLVDQSFLNSEPYLAEPFNSSSPSPLPPTEPERGFLAILKNRQFLTLWSGQIFSQLADKVYLVLMVAILTSHFPGIQDHLSRWVSAVMIAFTIPAVLFGAGAGVYVDRWSKKAVLVITNLCRGFLVLGLPLLLWLSQGVQLGSLPLGFCLLLIITFLVSTLTQFFAPAEQAVIPLIVEQKNLLSANSLYTTTMMGSVIIGFAVGEPILVLADRIGIGLGLAGIGKEMIVGGSYAIAGAFLLLLKTGEKRDELVGEPPHIFDDIKEGFAYLQQKPQVRYAMVQQIILFGIFAALTVLAVKLAEILPNIQAEQFGLLLAAAGLGMGIGATFVGYLGHRFSHFDLSLLGAVGMGGTLIGLSLFTNSLGLTVLMIMLLGVCGGMVGVPMQTTIQAETPEAMRGKVFGLQNNAINIALTLPLALAGISETIFGLGLVLWVLAGTSVTAGIVTWYIAHHNLPCQVNDQ